MPLLMSEQPKGQSFLVVGHSAVQTSAPALIYNTWHNKAHSIIVKRCFGIIIRNELDYFDVLIFIKI